MSDSQAFDRLQAMYASLYLRHQETLDSLRRANSTLKLLREDSDSAVGDYDVLTEVIADGEATIKRMEEWK